MDGHGNGNGDDRETGLAPIDTKSGGLGAPFAAMADALRANAEALHRLDANQRRLSETLDKSEKATNVIASTRALNETFKGLSEIQRGLLDAVIKDRGRGRGLPFAFAAIAILALLLGFVLYERWTGNETVSRELYQQALDKSGGLTREVAAERALAGSVRDEVERLRVTVTGKDDELARSARATAEAERRARDLGEELKRKDADLEANQGRVKNFLAVKEVADRTQETQIRNARLERESSDLRRRAERAERERDRLMEMMAEKRFDEEGPDPQTILDAARKKGLISEPPRPPKPDADGDSPITASQRRRLRKLLNRLLQQSPGEEAYDVISFGGIKNGTRLTDVRVARYRNATLLNSLNCKELEIVVDTGSDTVELRLYGGFLIGTHPPRERVPFGEDGHFVFLKDASVKDWLRRARLDVRAGDDGLLTWKSAGS